MLPLSDQLGEQQGTRSRVFPVPSAGQSKWSSRVYSSRVFPRVRRRARRESRRRQKDSMPSCSARAYMRVEGEDFVKLPKMPNYLSNCWRLFFFHLPKKSRCQPGLENSWRCLVHWSDNAECLLIREHKLIIATSTDREVSLKASTAALQHYLIDRTTKKA